MRPKGKLFALLAIFAAIGLVTATGAFTSVSATRTATVNVAGDADALLQLQPHNGNNGLGDGSVGSSTGYADIQSDELVINLGRFDGSGNAVNTGVNMNATTDIQGVFTITNQGTQDVWVNISDSGGVNGSAVTFYNASYAQVNSTNSGLETDETPTGRAIRIGTGKTLVVDIYVNTHDNSGLSDGQSLIDEIQIYAATDSSAFAETGEPAALAS